MVESLEQTLPRQAVIDYLLKSAIYSKEGLGSRENLLKGDSYILTLDTQRSLERIPCLRSLGLPLQAIKKFNDRIAATLQEIFAGSVPLVIFEEEKFYEAVDNLLVKAVNAASFLNARVVNLDRLIRLPKEKEDLRPFISTISIGRYATPDGEIITQRPGDPPLDDQIKTLEEDIAAKGLDRKIIIVDDGLFDIPCLDAYRKVFEGKGFEIIGYFVGVAPYGDGKMGTIDALSLEGKEIEVFAPCKNMFDWVCQRDFTFWGGKTSGYKDGLWYTSPYFAPFSDGKGASIPPDKLLLFSSRILRANLELLQAIQKPLDRKLVFKDLIEAGYGLPTRPTTDLFRPAEPDEKVEDFLAEALIELQSDPDILFSISGFNQITFPDFCTEILEPIKNKASRLIILCGSSGTGRSSITAELLKQSAGSLQIKRVTTRPVRKFAEYQEINTTCNEAFLYQVRQGYLSSQIIYRANSEYYGVSDSELFKLASMPDESLAFLEGTTDVLPIKKLLPEATLVLVLPPSTDVLKERLNQRGLSPDTQSRLEQSTIETKVFLSRLEELITTGIVNMVVVNNNQKKDAARIIEAKRTGNPIFDFAEIKELLKSLE